MLPANVNNALPQSQDFPLLFSQYSWDNYHVAFDWPPDNLQSGFPWIVSREERFRGYLDQGHEIPINLIVEMILWGGNQNDVLKKYTKGFRGNPDQGRLFIQNVVASLNNPESAIASALDIPGFGLTYGSKLLRFCRPEIYGALDNRIRGALGQNLRPIHTGRNSMIRGYTDFLQLLHQYKHDLRQERIARPAYSLRVITTEWTVAEIEMALFAWASNNQPNNPLEEDNQQ